VLKLKSHFLLITHTIAPDNLHFELNVTLGYTPTFSENYLCACSAFRIQNRVPSL